MQLKNHYIQVDVFLLPIMVGITRFFSTFGAILDANKRVIMRIGDTKCIDRIFTDQDVIDFARLSGDTNPIHLDSKYAEKTRFGKRIVHGILTGSLFSNLFGSSIEGSIYISQSFNFLAPVYIGDHLKATIVVKEINYRNSRVTCQTFCINSSGKSVLDGEAIIYVPNLSDQTSCN